MTRDMSEAAIATIGHNRNPFDVCQDDIDALYEEAGHWLNGDGVQSQEDHDAVDKLLDLARDAKKTADAARVEEKRPHDDAAKAVQAKWKPLIERADRVADTCKQVLKPWRDKIDREKREAAEQARREAEAAEIAAQEAFRNSGVGDLAEREEAERLAKAAKDAQKLAKRADKAATTGTGLRTYYDAEITDYTEFARYAWTNHRSEMAEFLDGLAARLVRQGARELPGMTARERKETV